MTKRMISLVMVVAMVLTLFAGLTLTVHADTTAELVTAAPSDGDWSGEYIIGSANGVWQVDGTITGTAICGTTSNYASKTWSDSGMTLTDTTVTNVSDDYVVVIEKISGSSAYSIRMKNTADTYIIPNGTSNATSMTTSNTQDASAAWAISYNTTSNFVDFNSTANTARHIGCTSSGNLYFRCYGNTNSSPNLKVYKVSSSGSTTNYSWELTWSVDGGSVTGATNGDTITSATKTLTLVPDTHHELPTLNDITVTDGTVALNGNQLTVTPDDNDGGAVDLDITFPESAKANLTFSVNGAVDSTLALNPYVGDTVTLPTPNTDELTYDSKTYEFVGWAETAAISDPTTTAPTGIVSGSYTVTGNKNFVAVYKYTETSSGSGAAASLKKLVPGTDTIADGDKIVIVAKGTTVALYQETTNTSYVQTWEFDNDVNTVAADDKNWVTFTASGDAWVIGDSPDAILYNSSNNLYVGSTSDTWTLSTATVDGADYFRLASDGRYLSYRNDIATTKWRMGGANGGTSGVTYLDLYRYVPGASVTTTNYYLTEAGGCTHNWEEYDRDDPTCVDTGISYQECSICHDTRDVELPALGHDWVAGTAVNPTCTAAGYTPYTCSRCTETKQEAGDAALGHDYVQYAIDEPTCSDTGTSYQRCSRCQNEIEVEIAATGVHTDTDNDCLCDVCSSKLYKLATSLPDGAELIIYSVGASQAMTTTAGGKGFTMGDVTIASNMLNPTADTMILEVEYDDDTYFYLKNGSKYLTSGATGNALTLEDTATEYSLWKMDVCSASEETVVIWNKSAAFNGKSQALEYYKGDFYPYGLSGEASAAGAAYQLKMYVYSLAHVHDFTGAVGVQTLAPTCTSEGVMTYTCVDPNCDHSAGYQTTEPIPMIAHVDANSDGVCDNCSGTLFKQYVNIEDGMQIVLVNPTYGDALDSEVSSYYMANAKVNALDGLLVPTDSILWNVEKTDGGFFLIDEDGNYLCIVISGSNYNLQLGDASSDNNVWTFGAATAGVAQTGLYLYNEATSKFVEHGNNNARYQTYGAPNATYEHLYGFQVFALPGQISYFANLTTESSDQGAILLNFYAKNAFGLNSATANGKAVAWTNSVDGVKVSVPVAMKDFKDDVELVLFDENDNAIGSTTYKVQTYLDQNANATGALGELIDAIDNLGRLAEAQFKHNSDAAELAAAEAAAAAEYATLGVDVDDIIKAVTVTNDDPDNVKFYGASLILEDQVTLRFYFKFGAGETPANYAISLDGNALDGVSLTKYNDSYWYFDISGIAAKELNKGYTVEVSYGNYSAKVEGFSPLTYAAQVIDKDRPEPILSLAKALFVYQAKAAAYFV